MEQKERKAPRIDFNLEIEIWGWGHSTITDLSTTGVFIYSGKSSQFKEGEGIDLLMKFPGEEEPMLVKAEVVRVAAEGIGVRFTNLPEAYAKVIEDCCSSSKPATQ
jgi:hypothetical protein